MNNDKIYISILVICTCISTGIMFCFNSVNYYVDNNLYSVVNDNHKGNELEAIKDNKLKDEEIELKEKVNIENVSNEDVDHSILIENEDIKNKYTDDLKPTNKKNGTLKSNEEHFVDLDSEEAIGVFKVDKNNIINEISNSDKLKLVKMANKLSIGDYNQLMNHIKRSDELSAAIDIFLLLKERLSREDYNELISVLDPYINIDTIENKINKK